jgi:polyhydroxyalkanoate synthesis regulator phasin
MPQRPDLQQYLDAGAQFVAMTRAEARRRAKELVAAGQLAQEQVQGFVDDLVEESRRRTDEMLDVVRKEIQRQVKQLGIVTKDDLAKLETRLARQSGAATKKTAAKQVAKAAAKRAAKRPAPRKAAGATKKAAS